MEDSPSGLWRTLGKRVGVTASRVRISYPPPGFEPRKPLKTFGFRGFALIPSDCRFPPGTLRFGTFGPRPAARVTYRNRRFRKRLLAPARRVSAIEARPRPTRPAGGPIRTPSCPRAVFSFWFATIPASVSQAHRSEYRSAQREGPPGPPPTNATRTHTGAMKVHSNRQSTPSYIDKKPRNVRRSDGSEGETGRPCRRHPSPGYSPANGTGTAMTAKEKT